MKLKNQVGAYTATAEGLVMNIKAAVALLYGDTVTMTGTVQDSTSPYLVGTKSAADSIALLGVVSELGGIALNGIGQITVFGIADVNVVSAVYNTPGAILCTNGGGAGTGAVGTPGVGKNIGLCLGDSGAGAVTQTKVFVNTTTR